MKARDIEVGMRFDNRMLGDIVVVKIEQEFNTATYHVYGSKTEKLEIVRAVDGNMEVGTPVNIEGFITLTSAQQHADEMLAMLKYLHVHYKLIGAGVGDLLNKIEPKPPTLEEAVALLKQVSKDTAMHPDVAAFLERAKCN